MLISLTKLASVVPVVVISVPFNVKVTPLANALVIVLEATVGQLAAQPPLPTLTHEPAVTRLPLSV